MQFTSERGVQLASLIGDLGKLALFSGLCVRARGWSRMDSERCHCLSIDSRSHIRHVEKRQDYSRL
jgi:hypothetical protein